MQTNIWIMLRFLFLDFCAFINDMTAGERTGNERERRTRSKGPQGGIKPTTAAARTQPLYMERPLYHLSYQGAPYVQF